LPMTPPLDGLKVVEFTHMVAGPACGQVLADFGAHVLKIEPPQGDVTRRLGPMVGDLSALYASTNRGKETVCLDLQSPTDAEQARKIALQADVVIANVDRRMLERSRLDAASLRAEQPALIFVEVTGFGPGGAPGTDGLAQATMGLMAMTGAIQGPGWRTGPSIVDVSTGVWAALGVFAALEHRRRTGQGDHVQTSLGDVCLYMQHSQLCMHDAAPKLVKRNGNHSLVSCTPVFQASDGRIILTLLHGRHWRSLCEVVGAIDLIDAAGFEDDEARCAMQSEIERRLDPLFRTRTRTEWISALREARVPCGPERDYDEVAADAELKRRGMLYRLPAGGADILQVRMPIDFDNTTRAQPRPAPRIAVKEA
jgi:crotonobetainyl-CoA:carnitine CoA-transferase CaiB-like acyl-CoA transferase